MSTTREFMKKTLSEKLEEDPISDDLMYESLRDIRTYRDYKSRGISYDKFSFRRLSFIPDEEVVRDLLGNRNFTGALYRVSYALSRGPDGDSAKELHNWMWGKCYCDICEDAPEFNYSIINRTLAKNNISNGTNETLAMLWLEYTGENPPEWMTHICPRKHLGRDPLFKNWMGYTIGMLWIKYIHVSTLPGVPFPEFPEWMRHDPSVTNNYGDTLASLWRDRFGDTVPMPEWMQCDVVTPPRTKTVCNPRVIDHLDERAKLAGHHGDNSCDVKQKPSKRSSRSARRELEKEIEKELERRVNNPNSYLEESVSENPYVDSTPENPSGDPEDHPLENPYGPSK